MSDIEIEFRQQCLFAANAMIKSFANQNHYSTQWAIPLLPELKKLSEKFGNTATIQRYLVENDTTIEVIEANLEDHYLSHFLETTEAKHPELNKLDCALMTVFLCLNTIDQLLAEADEFDMESTSSIKVVLAAFQTHIQTLRNAGVTQL